MVYKPPYTQYIYSAYRVYHENGAKPPFSPVVRFLCHFWAAKNLRVISGCTEEKLKIVIMTKNFIEAGTRKTQESVNNSINQAGGQAQITLSAEELNLLASMPKTAARLPQDMRKSEAKDAEVLSADSNVTLVDLEEVLFAWPSLTEDEIKFIEIIHPWLKEVAGGRKELQLSTSRIANLFRWLGYFGFGQRTIQRRLKTLWYKGVVTDRKLRVFDLQRYVELYYYSKVFVPLRKVFEPLAPVVQDKEMQRQAEQDEWERRKQLAMGLLNCYLAPWGVKVVDKEGRFK